MPKIQSVRVRAVRVSMAHPHRAAGGVVSESPLVLTDVFGGDGVVGHSMVFAYTATALQPIAALIRNLEDLIKGEPLAPVEIERKLSGRFRLLGTQGLVGIALTAIDMALWDALALRIQDGMAVVVDAIGSGVAWDEDAVGRYAI